MVRKIKNYLSKSRRTLRYVFYRFLRRFPIAARVYLWNRRQWKHSRNWWLANDRRYGVWWRIGNGAAAVLLLAAVVIPVLQEIVTANSYRLSADALKLVGNTDPKLAKQLKYDMQTSTYQFNKDAIKSDDANPLANLQNQVGTAGGEGKDKSLYALDVPTDLHKGVTYHDVNSGLSFSLVPEFSSNAGQDVNGHLVFPLAGDSQAVYTLKNNGLKEDIVLNNPTSNTMSFNYHLNLPKTLEAKALPDGSGGIGIYSADPTLFGDISYGSDADKARVEKARESADKTYLVFGLPSPVVKDTSGRSVGSARFELNGDELTVTATSLDDTHGALTIDPSVVITSASDFQTGGNNEGNIDFSTAGQIKRQTSAGGLFNAWTNETTNKLSVVRDFAGSAIWNGYIYLAGGSPANANNNAVATVEYTKIGSNGDFGAWTVSPNSFTTARSHMGAVAYNGYLYIAGGNDVNGNMLSDVQYAPINSDGTLGTWKSTTSLLGARGDNALVAYDGYLYELGGTDGNNVNYNDVEYAPFQADGTLGSWATTTSFTSARGGAGVVVYNGNIYLVGGHSATGGVQTSYADTQYASINADGTIGAWTTSPNVLPMAIQEFGLVAVNGYMYAVGGNNNGSTKQATTYVAAIYGNGSTGFWQTNQATQDARAFESVVATNNYIYMISGASAGGIYDTDSYYAQLPAPGSAKTYNQGAFNTGRNQNATVIYGGYIYVLGGQTGATTYTATVRVAPVGDDGSIGTWVNNTTYNFTTGRAGLAAVAYNGYLYIFGGLNGSTYYSDIQYTGIMNTTNGGLGNGVPGLGGVAGTWNTVTSGFSSQGARYGAGAFVYGGRVYLVGGYDGTTYHANTIYATLNPSTSAWTWTSTTSFTTGRDLFGLATAGNYVYVVGGYNGTSGLATVQYASVTSSGALSAWASAGGNFANARYGLNAVASKGVLEIVEGYDGTNYYNDVQYASINSNGTIGSWTEQGSVFPYSMYAPASVEYNGYLFITCGYDGPNAAYKAIAYSGIINNGGSVSPTAWTTNSTSMSSIYSTGWSSGQTVAYNGYLYAIGGYSGSSTTAKANVYRAPINADDSVGSWTAVSSMSLGRANFGVFQNDNNLFVVGGVNSSGTALNTYESVTINSDGSLGTWSPETTLNLAAGGSMPIRTAPAVTFYNSYVYITGGASGATSYNTVYYGAVNNASIGSLTAASTFTTGRSAHGAVAYNGYLYVFGGIDASGNYLSDFQYAAISFADGSLGSFTTGPAMTLARANFSWTMIDGALVLAGGTNSSGTLNNYDFITLANGALLDNWEEAATTFSTARSNAGLAVVSGVLYLMGGAAGSSYYNDVQYSILPVISRIAQYSKIVDLGTTTSLVTGISLNGTSTLSGSFIRYRLATSSGVFGTTQDAAFITNCRATGATFSRYVFVMITIDDSGKGSNGGYPDTLPGGVTDFTIVYNTAHPTPQTRLHGGKTLQSGTLTALDTCYP